MVSVDPYHTDAKGRHGSNVNLSSDLASKVRSVEALREETTAHISTLKGELPIALCRPKTYPEANVLWHLATRLRHAFYRIPAGMPSYDDIDAASTMPRPYLRAATDEPLRIFHPESTGYLHFSQPQD
ncbi:hypothetical protein M434DRAFT_27974 [Hypoxylon sp. CO27-5]|nr:hypothetical protein M434DRAFT_27974 [Hypoxylon sp. CO27-5]